MTWVLLLLVVVAAVVFVMVLRGRRRHHEPGVVSFRRHIDALSPEARREVHDRVRAQRDAKDGR